MYTEQDNKRDESGCTDGLPNRAEIEQLLDGHPLIPADKPGGGTCPTNPDHTHYVGDDAGFALAITCTNDELEVIEAHCLTCATNETRYQPDTDTIDWIVTATGQLQPTTTDNDTTRPDALALENPSVFLLDEYTP